MLGCTGGGTRLFAIGALLRHSSALAASLSLTCAWVATDAPWLAWHTEQCSAGSRGAGAVQMGVLCIQDHRDLTQFLWSLPAVG